MGPLSWRWGAVAALVAVLVSLPFAIAQIPASAASVTAQQLLAKVLVSDDVGWSGYAESKGTLELPDVTQLQDVASLAGDTTRLRAWVNGKDQYRVDVLDLTGEKDTSVDPDGFWTWTSADQTAVRVDGEVPVRLPTGGDLLPSSLGSRLARTASTSVTAIASKRIAGKSADGIQLTPADPANTTIDHVDIWALPSTGLVLRVEVYAKDAKVAALTSQVIDLDTATPSVAYTSFQPPTGSTITNVASPDLVAQFNAALPYELPATLSGLPRETFVGGLAGVGVYGDGFDTLTVVPIPPNTARDAISHIDSTATTVASFTTPLLNAAIGTSNRVGFLVVGTVPAATVGAVLGALMQNPPGRRS